MSGFYALLKKIEARPGLYIGSPSVSNLFMFLAGYQFSRAEQGLPVTTEEEAFAGFQPWLQQRFGLETTASWAKILILQAVDEGNGFELFFELLADFVESHDAESSHAGSDNGTISGPGDEGVGLFEVPPSGRPSGVDAEADRNSLIN